MTLYLKWSSWTSDSGNITRCYNIVHAQPSLYDGMRYKKYVASDSTMLIKCLWAETRLTANECPGHCILFKILYVKNVTSGHEGALKARISCQCKNSLFIILSWVFVFVCLYLKLNRRSIYQGRSPAWKYLTNHTKPTGDLLQHVCWQLFVPREGLLHPSSSW